MFIVRVFDTNYKQKRIRNPNKINLNRIYSSEQDSHFKYKMVTNNRPYSTSINNFRLFIRDDIDQESDDYDEGHHYSSYTHSYNSLKNNLQSILKNYSNFPWIGIT